MTTTQQPLKKYSDTASEKRFIVKMLLLLTVIFLFRDTIFSFGMLALIMAPSIAMVFLWIKTITSGETFLNTLRQYVTFMPVVYTEKEWRSERHLWATHLLILANIVIHYALIVWLGPERISVLKTMACLPEEPRVWNSLLSPLAAMFLHANAWHLWGNMVFLWVFGIVLERRIGWKRFLELYFATGIFSSIFQVVLPIIVERQIIHGFGASGAVAGVMGVFAVRLYYKRLVFPMPILGLFSLLLPLSLKIKLNSLLVIGIYFLSDLNAGMEQLAGSPSSIGHWAHVGGMAAGILLALRLKLQDQAIEEMHVERGIAAIEKGELFVDGEQALRLALERNPNNETALLALARERSRIRPSDEGRELYQRLLHLLLKSKPSQAAEIFEEYYALYRSPLDHSSQYRMAGLLHRRGNLDLASRVLETIADDPTASADWRERALFQLGLTLEDLRLPEAARYRYEQFLQRFPLSDNRPLVEEKLRKIPPPLPNGG